MRWEITRKQILALCGRKDAPWLIIGQPVEMVRLDCTEMQVRREDPLEAADRALLRLAEIHSEGITAKDAHEFLGLGSVLSFLLLIRLKDLGLLRMEDSLKSFRRAKPPQKISKSQVYHFSFVPTSEPKVDGFRFFIEPKGWESLQTNIIVEMNVEPVTIYYWAHPLRVVAEDEVNPDKICINEPPHFFTDSLNLDLEDLIPRIDENNSIIGMPLNYCGPTEEAVLVLTYVITRRNESGLPYPSWFYFTVSSSLEGDQINFFRVIWQQKECKIERFNDESFLKEPVGSQSLPPAEIGKKVIIDWIYQKMDEEELGELNLMLRFADGQVIWPLNQQFLECWLKQSGQPLLQEEPIWISGQLDEGQHATCKTKLIPEDAETAQLWFEIILKQSIRDKKTKFQDFDPLCDSMQRKWTQNWSLDFAIPSFDEFLTFLWEKQEYELIYQLREDVDLPYDGTTAKST